MKSSKPQLPLTQHFHIQKGEKISFIDERMEALLERGESLEVDIAPGPTVEEALNNIKNRKDREKLPHRAQLESELGSSLDWVRAQVGEKDALDLVEKDWLIVGETVFFASETPSYEEVKSAVQELADRKQKI